MVKLILPGGNVASRRKMMLLMTPKASSPPVFPLSNNNDPCPGNASDIGTESIGEPGHFRRESFGMASTNCSTFTSIQPKLTRCWKPDLGDQFFNVSASHGG